MVEIKEKIIGQMVSLFTASVAFVAALAWNEAVISIFTTIPYFEDKGISSRVIYAIIVTIIAVVVSTFLANLLSNDYINTTKYSNFKKLADNKAEEQYVSKKSDNKTEV